MDFSVFIAESLSRPTPTKLREGTADEVRRRFHHPYQSGKIHRPLCTPTDRQDHLFPTFNGLADIDFSEDTGVNFIDYLTSAGELACDAGMPFYSLGLLLYSAKITS